MDCLNLQAYSIDVIFFIDYCCIPSVAPEVFEFTFLLNKDISIFPNL